MHYHALHLSNAPASLSLLKSFYTGLYSREFPDPDERESLDNMENYLSLKDKGWYGKNNYHIILLLDMESNEVTGGVVADYLEEPNAGIVEFIVVETRLRGAGLGRQLLNEICAVLKMDAFRAGHADLDGVAAEVNDPYRRCDVEEHLDGFARLRMWDRFGFRLLDFPYVQPSLGPGQVSVLGLGLMFLPLNPLFKSSIPSRLVTEIVKNFQIWAMRIENPGAEPDFSAMRDYLRTREEVALLSMSEYIAEEIPSAFTVVELGKDDPRFLEFAKAYSEIFHDTATAVDISAFTGGSRQSPDGLVPYHYWLWGLDAEFVPGFCGVASFFALPYCGFGGYLALLGDLRSRGLFRHLLRLIERKIIEASKASSGWYVECEPDSMELSIFRHCGFTPIPMTYRQPCLHTDSTGKSMNKRLELLFKPFGRLYGYPSLSLLDLKRDMSHIFAAVYHLNTWELQKSFDSQIWPGKSDNIFSSIDRFNP